MNSAPDILDAFATIARRCQSDPDPAVRAAAAEIEALAKGEPRTLILRNSVGKSWRLDAALADCDRVLRGIARRYRGNLDGGEQARELAKRLSFYRGNGWLRDRTSTECPRRPDTMEAALWAVLRCRDCDIGERRMKFILDGN
jgi:hypothetical protein